MQLGDESARRAIVRYVGMVNERAERDGTVEPASQDEFLKR